MENLIIKNDERTKQLQSWEMNEEIQIFREYLRFPTVHPNINYRKSLEIKINKRYTLDTKLFLNYGPGCCSFCLSFQLKKENWRHLLSWCHLFIASSLCINIMLRHFSLSFLFHHPTEPCVEFLKRLGEDLGLRVQIECPVTPSKPIVILSMLGTQPDLKSIVLNSHIDVVPVFEEYWTHKPFDAVMDETGRIFARGAQDMKSVGMQYLGALRFFQRKQITFRRTIHVIFVPEEELGGDGGMADFVHSLEFRNLNVGFALDEGSSLLPTACDVNPFFLQALLHRRTSSTFTMRSVAFGTSSSRSTGRLAMARCC